MGGPAEELAAKASPLRATRFPKFFPGVVVDGKMYLPPPAPLNACPAGGGQLPADPPPKRSPQEPSQPAREVPGQPAPPPGSPPLSVRGNMQAAPVERETARVVPKPPPNLDVWAPAPNASPGPSPLAPVVPKPPPDLAAPRLPQGNGDFYASAADAWHGRLSQAPSPASRAVECVYASAADAWHGKLSQAPSPASRAVEPGAERPSQQPRDPSPDKARPGSPSSAVSVTSSYVAETADALGTTPSELRRQWASQALRVVH